MGTIRRQLRSLSVIVALSAWIGCANAATYNVNRVVGSGSVVGFIETDGTLGALSQLSIVDYSLKLTSSNLSGGSPQTLAFANSHNIGILGTGLSATSTDLLFDFSGSGWFFIQDFVGSLPFYGLGTTEACGGGCVGEYIGWNTSVLGPAELNVVEPGSVISFATTGSAVPEPTTIGLLGLGMFALVLARRKQTVSR